MVLCVSLWSYSVETTIGLLVLHDAIILLGLVIIPIRAETADLTDF